MIEVVNLTMLESIARQLQGISNIRIEDGRVQFDFRDVDGDDLPMGIAAINEEKALIAIVTPVPESRFVCGMLLSNRYNALYTSSDVVALATATNRGHYLVLQAPVSVDGGVTETYIRRRFRSFLDSVDHYVAFMLSGFEELGSDDDLMQAKGGVWEAIGAFAGGFVRGYAD